MQVELSEFNSTSHSIGKAISWSKKMYVWEFAAKMVNDQGQEKYQKYRIEFRDSVNSGKSTVVFNGVTLLYKSKIIGFGIAPYILQVKPIEISLVKDQKKQMFKTFDLRVAGMSFSHLKKAGGKIPLFLKSALPEQIPQQVKVQEPTPSQQVAPPTATANKPQKENQPPVEPVAEVVSTSKESQFDNFFNFEAQPEVKKVVTQKPAQHDSVLSLDSEFDFSKNEPLKKQNTMQNDVDDFFDFAKGPEPSVVLRSQSQYCAPVNGPMQADQFFSQQQFSTVNPSNFFQIQQPMLIPQQQFAMQQQFMQPGVFATNSTQFGTHQPLRAFNTNFQPQFGAAMPNSNDCLFTDKYKSFYIQQMAQQNQAPANAYGFDHLAQYQTRSVQQNTKNDQLNSNLGSLINLN